jgi:hypothetical protein
MWPSTVFGVRGLCVRAPRVLNREQASERPRNRNTDPKRGYTLRGVK